MAQPGDEVDTEDVIDRASDDLLDAAERDPEAPEVDAAEQAWAIVPDGRDLPVTDDPEVNEADALEQARVVVGDDDDYER